MALREFGLWLYEKGLRCFLILACLTASLAIAVATKPLTANENAPAAAVVANQR